MLRPGAAAATDQAGAGRDHVAAESGKVVWGRQKKGAAVDQFGETGVGEGRQRPGGGRRQPAQHLQHGARPGPAVGAQRRRVRALQLLCGLFDAQSVAAEAPFDKGQLGDGRQAELVGDVESEQQIGNAGKGFEQEAVDPPFGQGAHLGVEEAAPGGAVQLDTVTARRQQRPDRTGHQALRPGRGAGQLGTGAVDRRDLVLETVGGQAQGIGAEGVGFQQLGAGRGIGGVHSADQARVDQVEVLEDRVDRGAVLMELGSHGAIADDHWAMLQAVKQLVAAFGGGHRPAPLAAGSVTSRNWRRIAAVSPQMTCSP
jgi:hypothetical protein